MGDPVLCPECVAAGEKSTCHTGRMWKTAKYCAPFYDSTGSLHHHDSNVTTREMVCSRGHKWEHEATGSCWCGWPETRAVVP